jgi:hypothetical protein
MKQNFQGIYQQKNIPMATGLTKKLEKPTTTGSLLKKPLVVTKPVAPPKNTFVCGSILKSDKI